MILILGIVTAYAVPDLARGSDQKSVRGAANVLQTLLSTARTVAITRGRCATVHLSSNKTWVTSETCGGSPIDTITTEDLARAYGVTAQACAGAYCDPADALDYALDPRGIPYSGQSATWVVFRNAAADTLQVGQFGLVQ